MVWPRGSVTRRQTVSFWIKAWQAVGGQAANTSGALKYLLKQVEELASNRDLQPPYIQWTATADSSALYNATELHDGWYIIDDFEPNYQRNVVMGIVQCRMTVTEVAPGAPRRVSLAYSGAALSTNYSGAATNFISLPLGSTALEASVTRTAAEGSIPCIVSPQAGGGSGPEPLVLSTTIANVFKGGVHVYDTINTGTNAVPIAGGTFVNANWVEVFYTDHNFVGDCVITNGLQLILFQTGVASQLALCYLWQTALATANWQQYGNLLYQDNAGGATGNGVLRSYTLTRVGPEECALTAITSSTSATPSVALVNVRLQRGRYDVRVDFRPLSQASTTGSSLYFNTTATPKFFYNSTKISDNVLGEASPAFATDYGYGAALVASTSFPYIVSFLYQNEPVSQPVSIGTNIAFFGLGDSTSLAINAQRSYGFFAIPYGSSGVYSTANLQAEAESGTLGTGWTSQAGAGGNSNALEAKNASGTATGNSDTWGTAFVPAPGTYDVWFRVKVTSAASATAQMQMGLYDNDTAAYVPLASTTYAPNQWTTGYTWLRANIRTVADGATNTNTTVTSATAVFTSATDVGKAISGGTIPAGATISSVTNATTVVISAAATGTATGVTLTIGAAITPTATKNMRFRATTVGTTGTDFFIDESALVPKTLTTANTGPQEIYQQFAYDRGVRMVRP